MTCTMVFCKAGDTKSGKMESRTPGNLKVRFGGRLTHDPSGRSQPISLVGTSLKAANLQNTDLEGVNLEGADLRQADLEGANLEGANLKGADLTDIKYNAKTTWPEGFTPPPFR